MKTVLVTGGTLRLGGAIADAFRAAGWRVAASSHRPEAGADIVADLSAESGADRLYEAALDLFGRPPDALVNNAALFAGPDARLEAVNLRAPVRLTELMAARGSAGPGAVVNLLDSQVFWPVAAGESFYLGCKRRLRAETVRSARDFASTLRVNAVAPGPVLVPVGMHVSAGATLLSRRPTPEDVASAVLYLAEAASVTGVVIPVDAGQHLAENAGL